MSCQSQLHIFRILRLSRAFDRISFLPQSFLLENIKERPQSISPFLLLSILTVAAGWTPGLTKKHGGPLEAGDYFYHRAKGLIAAEMLKPSLQACQSCQSVTSRSAFLTWADKCSSQSSSSRFISGAEVTARKAP